MVHRGGLRALCKSAKPKAPKTTAPKTAASSSVANDRSGPSGTDAEFFDMITEELNADHRLIAPVYTFIVKDKKKLLALQEDVLASAIQEEVGTLGKLSGDAKVDWVASHSDLTGADLLQMIKKDASVLNTLMQLGLQLQMKAKLPEKLNFVEVRNRFLQARYDLAGRRLDDLKKSGGVTNDKRLNLLSVGCYSLTFAEDLLCGVTHRATGEKVEIHQKYRITREYSLVDNHDDFGASVVLDPCPPQHLHMFFKAAKTGHYATPTYIGRPGKLEDDVAAEFKAWETELRQRLPTSGVAAAIAEDLGKHKKELLSASMQKARTLAKQQVAENKKRRTISLSSA